MTAERSARTGSQSAQQHPADLSRRTDDEIHVVIASTARNKSLSPPIQNAFMPAACAPRTSCSRESPTCHAADASTPAACNAAAKIRASGFSAPTSQEIVIESK